MKINTNLLYVLKKTAYFALPVVLLYIILKNADLNRLVILIKESNPIYILLGVAIRPLQIAIGSHRWHIFSTYYSSTTIPLGISKKNYWTGLAIGYFTPGNVGWEAHKVISTGKVSGSYLASVLSLVAEKLLGLLSVLVVIMISFPLVFGSLEINRKPWLYGYLIALAALLIIVIVRYSVNRKWVHATYDRFRKLIGRMIRKITAKYRLIDENNKMDSEDNKVQSLFSLVKNKRAFSRIILLSMAILLTSSLGLQFLFMGLGYSINFMVNIFAAPVFLVLFLIPISFGSIGVRESAYILLYSQFGVPLETALAVSFLNLFGLLLNSIIGAAVMFVNNIRS